MRKTHIRKIAFYLACLLLLAAGCGKQAHPAVQSKEGAPVVTAPKAGEVVHQGTAQSVQWKYDKNENVNIALCSSRGCDELAGNMPNSGEYKWGVIATPGEGYTIEVYPVSDKSLSGRSGEFEIAGSK